MPVLTHDTHERTRIGSDFRYGCHNKPRRRDPIFVKSGYDLDGLRWSWVPDAGSLECRYDMSLKDFACEGCQHRGSGEAYDQQVRENGK